MSDDIYNVLKNRETWAVALHLSNDERVYHLARHFAERGPIVLGEWVGTLFELLYFPQPDDGPIAEWIRLMASDVGSLWRVDWDAVVESLTDDV
jgi:hypothetical protein